MSRNLKKPLAPSKKKGKYMFLGIPYNKWHFILSIVAVAFAFFVFWYFLSGLLVPEIGKIFSAFLGFAFSVQIAHHLQCWNEIKQALDPAVEEKYGNGYQSFQKDSRDDFRWFWFGISVSWLIPLIIVLI
jgi:cell division protein FtsX